MAERLVVDEEAWVALARWLHRLDPERFLDVYVDLLQLAQILERQAVLENRAGSHFVTKKIRTMS